MFVTVHNDTKSQLLTKTIARASVCYLFFVAVLLWFLVVLEIKLWLLLFFVVCLFVYILGKYMTTGQPPQPSLLLKKLCFLPFY